MQLRCQDRLLGGTGTMPNVQDTGEAQAVFSRYYPITSYMPCSNDRPWANCLDSPCLINKGDPSKATCICTETKNQGTYLFYSSSGKYTPTSCNTGLYSWQQLTVQTKSPNTYKHTTRLLKRRQSRSWMDNNPQPAAKLRRWKPLGW